VVLQAMSSFVRPEPKELKSIFISDHFYQMAIDTIGLLPKTYNGNMYILVAIDHYVKWCKTKVMVDHDTKIATRFLEDEVKCKFGVPKYILSNNGSEWVA
jgi:hypothetical protein